MKWLIIFLVVFLYADISDILIKIREIENMKKSFLNIDYNIFGNNTPIENNFIRPVNNNETELKIFAIFNDKVNINGKWYKVGDEVENYKILKITFDKVFLEKGGKVIILKSNYLNILKVK